MGLYDRDYYREAARGPRDWVPGRVVTSLIAVYIGLFIVQIMVANAQNRDTIYAWGCFRLGPFLDGELWRFFTASFLFPQQAVFALVFSMLTLFCFGRGLELELRGPEFLSFWCVAALFSQTIEMLVRVSLDDRSTAVSGPAGPILGLIVLFALRHPRDSILFLFIPMPAWIAALLFVVLALMSFSASGLTLPLAGAFFAFAYHSLNLRITASWPRQARPRLKPKLRIVPREADEAESEVMAVLPMPHKAEIDEHLEAKVDYVLEKLARDGRESLSVEENEVLSKASEVYRRRRKD